MEPQLPQINGVNYYNNLPQSSNGDWSQTIAYLLDLMYKFQKEQAEAMSGDTGTTISVIQSVLLPRNIHIEVYESHPITCKTTVQVEKHICRPTPKVIKVPNTHFYTKCCGRWNPINSKYVECMRKVDNCYNTIKATKGYVEEGDIHAASIKLSDCGCKLVPPTC